MKENYRLDTWIRFLFRDLNPVAFFAESKILSTVSRSVLKS